MSKERSVGRECRNVGSDGVEALSEMSDWAGNKAEVRRGLES